MTGQRRAACILEHANQVPPTEDAPAQEATGMMLRCLVRKNKSLQFLHWNITAAAWKVTATLRITQF